MEKKKAPIKKHNVCGPHARNPLRMARMLEGVPQANLGKIVSRSQSWISRLEAELITASITQRQKIGQALGIPANVLFPEE